MGKQNYYLFNPGRMSRKDNTLRFIITDEQGQESRPKYLPIEGINNLYIFGSVDANSAVYNFLGKKGVAVHFFDYYEHYTGSFQPKEYLLAGKMQVEQTRAYLSKQKRQHIARSLIESASFNMLKNLKYYQTRGRELSAEIEYISGMRQHLLEAQSIDEIMGLEGNIRQTYYQAFEEIIPGYAMDGRSKQPPKNEVNALISFGNMVAYTLSLDMIFHTQLNPTISFLHEPGTRRYSLALDLSEVFKPILVDRNIFRLLNRKELQERHFEERLGGILLSPSGKKIYLKSWENRINETIQHRKLGKKVRYKNLVKLECYKLAKYILGMEERYEAFKIWW